MEKTFGLTAEQEKIILMNSINAAFTSENVKKDLKKQLKLNNDKNNIFKNKFLLIKKVG